MTGKSFSRSLVTGVALFTLACNAPDAIGPAAVPAPSLEVSPSSARLSINFESYPLGALGSPWGGYAGGSDRITVVNTTDHGHALRMVAGTTTSDYLSYGTSFPQTSSAVTVAFDIKPATGASPTFILRGSGYGASQTQFRLMRIPGSNALIAGTTTTGPRCGNLVNGAWNHVVLKVNPTSKTFSVTINGAGVAACTNAPTTLGTPYKGIGVFDPSNTGYGGTTDWDNFVVS